MTRFTSIHELTRYEVIVRGVQSRSEAEAIVNAVEALPQGSAWIPFDPDACPAPTAASEAPYIPDASELPGPAFADVDDAAPEMMSHEEAITR